MKIKIGDRAYIANPSMIALLRYYTVFGESFLSAYFDGKCDVLELARLVWASLDDPKPDFAAFLGAAAESDGFAAAAYAIQSAVLAAPVSSGKGNTAKSTEPIDEFDILALMTVSGIDMGLIHILPVFYIVEIASRKNALVLGHKDPPKRRFYLMSQEEIREEYGRRGHGGEKKL